MFFIFFSRTSNILSLKSNTHMLSIPSILNLNSKIRISSSLYGHCHDSSTCQPSDLIQTPFYNLFTLYLQKSILQRVGRVMFLKCKQDHMKNLLIKCIKIQIPYHTLQALASPGFCLTLHLPSFFFPEFTLPQTRWHSSFSNALSSFPLFNFCGFCFFFWTAPSHSLCLYHMA